MIKETKFITENDLKILKLAKKAKLNVSSIKYSKGHDADCMSLNLKIGNKIKALVWDDSWGGGFEYQIHKSQEDLDEVMNVINSIIKEVGTYTYRNLEIEYSADIIIDILIQNLNLEKKCKSKTIVQAIISDSTELEFDESNRHKLSLSSFTYNVPFGDKRLSEEKIKADFEKDNFTHFEIINKRFGA